MQRVISCYGDAGVYTCTDDTDGETGGPPIFQQTRDEHNSSTAQGGLNGFKEDDDSPLVKITSDSQTEEDPSQKLRRIEFWIRASQSCSGGYESQLVLGCRRTPEQTAYEQAQLLERPLSLLCVDNDVSTIGGPTHQYSKWASECFRSDRSDGNFIARNDQKHTPVRSCWMGISNSAEPVKVVRYGVEFGKPLTDHPISVQWYLEGSNEYQDGTNNPFPGSWEEDLRVWQNLDERNVKTPDSCSNQCIWFDLSASTAALYRSYRLHIYCGSNPLECINIDRIHFVKEDVNTSCRELVGWTLGLQPSGYALKNSKKPIFSCSYQLVLTTERGMSLLSTQPIMEYGKWYKVTLDLLSKDDGEEVGLAIDGNPQLECKTSACLASPGESSKLFKFGIGSNCLCLSSVSCDYVSKPEVNFLRLMLLRRSAFGAEWNSFVGDLAEISETRIAVGANGDLWEALETPEIPHKDYNYAASLPPFLQHPFLSFGSMVDYMQRFSRLLNKLNCFAAQKGNDSPGRRTMAALVHDCGLTNYKEDAVDATCFDPCEMSDTLCRGGIGEGNLYIGPAVPHQRLQRAGVNLKGTKGHCYRVEHWSHFDCFIYFGHQRVSIPPSPWIRAAKAQRGTEMRVLGTIITEHKEGEADTWNMLDGFWPSQRRLPGTFEGHRIIRSLAQLARVRGFDGWLVNLESDLPGCSSNPTAAVAACRGMLEALTVEVKQWVGNRLGTVLWYDSITTDGIVDWQSCLNDRNATFAEACDGIFCDYHWKDTGGTAPEQSLKQLNSRCVNKDVLYGTDVWGRGTFGGGKESCRVGVLPPVKTGLAVALFAPAWNYENDSIECSGALGAQQWERAQNMLWHGHGTCDPKWEVSYSSTEWDVDSPDLQWFRFPSPKDAPVTLDVACFTPPSNATTEYESLVFSEKLNANLPVGYYLLLFYSKLSLKEELSQLSVWQNDIAWSEASAVRVLASAWRSSSIVYLHADCKKLAPLLTGRSIGVLRINPSATSFTAEQANFKLTATEKNALAKSMLPCLSRNSEQSPLPLASICSLPFFSCFCVGCGEKLWRYGVEASDTTVDCQDGITMVEKQHSSKSNAWINLGATEAFPSFLRNESSGARILEGERDDGYIYPFQDLGWDLGNSLRVTRTGCETDRNVVSRLFVGSVAVDTLQRFLSLCLVYHLIDVDDRAENWIKPRIYFPQGDTLLSPDCCSRNVHFGTTSWEAAVWEFDFHEQLHKAEHANTNLLFEIDLVCNKSASVVIGEIGVSCGSERRRSTMHYDEKRIITASASANMPFDASAVLHRDAPTSVYPDSCSLYCTSQFHIVKDLTLGGADVGAQELTVSLIPERDIPWWSQWGIALYWYRNNTWNLRGWDIYCEGKWISFVSSNHNWNSELATISGTDDTTISPYYLLWFPMEEDRALLHCKEEIQFFLVPRYSVAVLLSETK